jgi:hypothetical protein
MPLLQFAQKVGGPMKSRFKLKKPKDKFVLEHQGKL